MAERNSRGRWTDLFVRRPVLGVTLATVIAVMGLFGMMQLTVREYPQLTTTQVSVSTSYPGASPQTVQSYITQPLSRVLGSTPDLDYMTSSSSQGSSTVTLRMHLNANPQKALANALSEVREVQSLLPKDSYPPVVNESAGHQTALMYISFYSPGGQMNTAQIVDYVVRNAQPLLQTVLGVSQAQVFPPGGSGGNGNNQAVRVWLNPKKMAARNVTPAGVRNALADQNVVAAVGETRSNLISAPLTSNLEMTSADQFKDLVVKTVDGTPVYLKDVARVTLGAESYSSEFYYDGKPAVAIGIQTTPDANDLSVAQGVTQRIASLREHLPPGLKIGLPYNGADFIQIAIHEVMGTIGITVLVVVAVIFLFLGSLRGLLVPAIAIPLSLGGAGIFMFMAGYSLNLLTLLAMVLAIGLVVDDAIVMVENVHRHIDEGRSGFQAAAMSARELTMPVIVMSTTLVAVFLPVAFSGGITGSLFTEFAFTIVFAVVISMVLALTLSPMLSGKVLRQTPAHGLNHFLDSAFERLRALYDRSLHGFLEFPVVGLVFVVATFVALYFLYGGLTHELSPPQNSGVVFATGSAQPNAAPGYLKAYGRQILQSFHDLPERKASFLVTGFSPTGGGNTGLIGGVQLKPFSERASGATASDLKPKIQREVNQIPGLKAAAFTRPPLPGASGLFPIDFVLTASTSYDNLAKVADQLVQKAEASGKFMFLNKDLKIDQPQPEVDVDRKMAASLGISMQQIAADLQPMLAGAYVNRYTQSGYAYQVIPQVPDAFRDKVQDLGQYYVRAASGKLIPLSTLVSFKTRVIPEQLPQFDRINSVTIQGVPFPGVSQGEALSYLRDTAHQMAPDYQVNYGGQSRQFMKQGNTFAVAVVLALILIYLLLSAQFNSFRDALIVMFAVPMSAAGALLFMDLGFASLNIYTQIALITLIGLITKQGILVVQFANQVQREEGLGLREAVEKAASIRLRPILMTTLAMVLGVMPLIVATGTGAPPRNQLGIVIASGLGVGALFSLYIVPTMYLYLAKTHSDVAEQEAEQDRALAELESEQDRRGDRE
ncbi:MAG TPA: efflux RND transporter permease subunit [Gammaproteobacteria bacterium]|nr:efflux RND transporter permease subunit [Gammaproteobacteria bacterium]